MNDKYTLGTMNTAAGIVPQVSSAWNNNDIWSTIQVRWSIGRMSYSIKPGLYAVGKPGADSSVFVTGNYKLSFDHVRRALNGMDAWMLVLDTKGINVWCAAGKGTFGTSELEHRIKIHELHKLVNHRTVIVPQLGAVGVSAHEIKHNTGFRIIYGPVRADDIKAFVTSGFRATPEMRKVQFTLLDRIKLIPVELAYAGYYLILIPAIFFILSGLYTHGYSVDKAWSNGGKAVINLIGAYISGCVLTPILLPWIPFKRFSLKGLLIGWILAAILTIYHFLGNNSIEIVSWFLIIGGISSFLAMNFTGSSTFTSLSGVQKEMKLSLPLQIIAVSIGFMGWIITKFI